MEQGCIHNYRSCVRVGRGGDKKDYLSIWSGGVMQKPELSKCVMPLLINYKSKLVGDGLELKRIGERLLI